MTDFLAYSNAKKKKVELVLSDFIDSGLIQWTIIGSIAATGTGVDGIRIVPFNCNIIAVYMAMVERGNDGNTIIDINVGTPSPALTSPGDSDTNIALSTIYTNQANRPTIPGDSANKNDNYVLLAQQPDIVSLVKGQILSFDVDQKVSSSRDLTAALFVKQL